MQQKFYIGYDKIEIMKYFTQNPTKNENKKPETRKYRRQMLNLLTPIYDHREGRVGDDVTLYYQQGWGQVQ